MASMREILNKIRDNGIKLGVNQEGGLRSVGELKPEQSKWFADHKQEILAELAIEHTESQFALIREVLSTPISDKGEIPLDQALVIGHLENSVLISLNEQQEWVATESGNWFLTTSEKQGRPAQESLWEGYGKKKMYSLAEWLIASCTTPLACLESTLLQMIQRKEVNFRMDKQTGQWMPVWNKYEAQRQREAA